MSLSRVRHGLGAVRPWRWPTGSTREVIVIRLESVVQIAVEVDPDGGGATRKLSFGTAAQGRVLPPRRLPKADIGVAAGEPTNGMSVQGWKPAFSV
jgi:hypothetical protein